MARELLNLCAAPRPVIRNGMTGQYARMYLPFLGKNSGYWFANGMTIVFPSATIPQDNSLTLSGTVKPNTYMKDCCSCFQG